MEEIYRIDDHFSLKALRLLLKIVGMWPIDNARDRLISYIALNVTITTVGTAFIVEATDFFYSWGDLNAVSNSFTNMLTVLIELIKVIKFTMSKNDVVEFNAYTEKKFWKPTYDRTEWEILEKCNQKSKNIMIAHVFFSQCVVWLSMSMPIAEGQVGNSSTRELPVNVYFNYPYRRTPFYELAYLTQICAAMGVGICAATFSGFLGTINFYAAGQFKILQRKLENAIFDMKNEKTEQSGTKFYNQSAFLSIRNCIAIHQTLILYVEKVENLFSFILLVQSLGSVMLLCFCGFQILLGVGMSAWRTALSIQYLLGAIVQLFLFSWPCHEIILESTEVAEAAYRASWFQLPNNSEGRACRQCLLIMIVRARRPCILTVGKFAPMSLQTFTSIINSAMSYFTVLRQMQEADE